MHFVGHMGQSSVLNALCDHLRIKTTSELRPPQNEDHPFVSVEEQYVIDYWGFARSQGRSLGHKFLGLRLF